jgi:hypothetical protein
VYSIAQLMIFILDLLFRIIVHKGEAALHVTSCAAPHVNRIAHHVHAIASSLLHSPSLPPARVASV